MGNNGIIAICQERSQKLLMGEAGLTMIMMDRGMLHVLYISSDSNIIVMAGDCSIRVFRSCLINSEVYGTAPG